MAEERQPLDARAHLGDGIGAQDELRMTLAEDLVVPTVHLNGTSKAELLQQVLDAMKALSTASGALARMSPHGRDYYVQGDGAYARARDAHQRRRSKVEAVIAELETLAAAIQAQPGR